MTNRDLDDPRVWQLDTYVVPPGSLRCRAVVIDGPEGHHAIRVARVREGDFVRLIDGRGSEAIARVERTSSSSIEADILDARTRSRDEGVRLTVAQSLLKGRSFDEIVRRCAELGVAAIVPLVTERTAAGVDGRVDAKRIERWEGIAAAAVKQSRGVFLPRIEAARNLSEIGALARGSDLALVAWEEEGAASLRETLRGARGARTAVLVVGPEGGLTPAEIAALAGHGARSVSVGRRILKADWAAAAIAAMIAYEVGELLP